MRHSSIALGTAAVVSLCGTTQASPDAACKHGPSPQIVCHTPPSADLPAGTSIQFPAPAATANSFTDGAITFNVTFNDGGQFEPFHAVLTSHLVAAGNAWARVLGGSGSIEIVVVPFNGPRFGGRSLTTAYVGLETIDGAQTRIWMQGAAAELRDGVDPNGAAPDIEISISNFSDYHSNELWFDPNPELRTAPVPSGKTDAMSVCLHELGHAFGFNGWRDWSTGALPPPLGTPPLPYASTFDRYADVSGSFEHFGPATVAEYGTNTPLTNGNIFHYGNAAPQPGSDLIPWLMNGVVLFRGTRYNLAALELATLDDANVMIVPPCYGNCDGSSGTLLSPADFACFLNKYRAGDTYANCDGSTPTMLSPADFSCFLSKYRAGCN